MKLEDKRIVASTILQQRNFAYIICSFLMVVTFVLLAKVWSKNDRIIVIPSFNEMEKQYQLEGNHIPDNYIVDWGFSLLSNVFTVNPKTVSYKNAQFLKWALSSSGLNADLQKSAKSLKRDNISTAFYPESHRIDRDSKEIIIEGRFLTFFGKSKKPVVTQRSFSLGWQLMPNGHMAINSLKEIKYEK